MDLSDPRAFVPDEVPWFKGIGAAITALREQRGSSRDELAARANFATGWLEEIEAGTVAAPWGDLRRVARALDMELPALIREGEKREANER